VAGAATCFQCTCASLHLPGHVTPGRSRHSALEEAVHCADTGSRDGAHEMSQVPPPEDQPDTPCTLPSMLALVTTDAPLGALAKDAQPLAPTLLINYDLPMRKVGCCRDFVSSPCACCSPLGAVPTSHFVALVPSQDDYARRISAVLGSRVRAGGRRLTVNFTEAGKLSELRRLEDFAQKDIHEMPVRVADLFRTPSKFFPSYFPRREL